MSADGPDPGRAVAPPLPARSRSGPPVIRAWLRRWLAEREPERRDWLAGLVNDASQPRLDAMARAVRDTDIAHLTIKAFGYDLARRLAEALPVPPPTAPRTVGLRCSASVQADIESDWLAHWAAELQVPIVYHRKLWELAYVLQAMHEHGHLRAGARALGFGCGTEVIPSYLAAQGVAVTVTDQPPADAAHAGWAATAQHAASLDGAFHPHLVAREAFDAQVTLRHVDMNAMPDDLAGYDCCWSVCAIEHLGSIARGLGFVERALATLRPGGLAVHTTELNLNPDGPTVDNWPTVLFQRRHFEALAAALAAQGHRVAPLDFALGDRPMDRFIDVPPYDHDLAPALAQWVGPAAHLKLGIDGFPCTCFGLIVRRAE